MNASFLFFFSEKSPDVIITEKGIIYSISCEHNSGAAHSLESTVEMEIFYLDKSR